MSHFTAIESAIKSAAKAYVHHLEGSLVELQTEILTTDIKTAIQDQWEILSSPEAIALYQQMGNLIILAWALTADFAAQAIREQKGDSPDYLTARNFARACMGRPNKPAPVAPAPEATALATLAPYCHKKAIETAFNSVVKTRPTALESLTIIEIA